MTMKTEEEWEARMQAYVLLDIAQLQVNEAFYAHGTNRR